MCSALRLRVLVTLGEAPVPEWHRRVVDTIRGERADVIVLDPRSPAPSDANRDAHIVVDLGGVSARFDAPLGTWRYGFGDGAAWADGATGTLARLYRTTSDPACAVVLHEGWFKGASRESAGTRSVGDRVAPWCARVLRQIAAGDLDVLGGPRQPMTGACDREPPPLRGAIASLVDRTRRWRRRERWTIGIVPSTLPDLLARASIAEPRWVTGGPSDGFLADPFPVSEHQGTIRLLAERYRYRSGRGSIATFDVTGDGRIVQRREWLTPPHHAAYPFVLRDGTETFCVPDVGAAGAARAYRLEDGGRFETLLDRFPAVDPTLVHHDGTWWLFCTHREQENQTELHLFHASEWRGPWQPHLLNPVKSDARSSRPAGTPLVIDGALYRPAQDCSRRYGGAVSINRIAELTPTRFREERVLTLAPLPSWAFPHGMHTLNAINELVVVDGLRVEG